MSGSQVTDKAKIVKKIIESINKKNRLARELTALKEDYQKLKEKHQPLIINLQLQADEQATEFRRLYEESQEAYQNDEKGLAKELATQGHEAQDECEALNNQINALKQELKNQQNQVDSLYAELRDINDTIANFKNESRTMGDNEHKHVTRDESLKIRKTTVSGFDNSKIISNLEVENLLDQLPQGLFELIQEVKFLDEIKTKDGRLIAGNYHWDKKAVQAKIEIYSHGFQSRNNRSEILTETKRTIIHEIGHLIFREFISDRARWLWGNYYLKSMQNNNFITGEDTGSRDDDFSECFVKFILNPKELEKLDRTRYDFIKKVWDITFD
jgi:seryl-tRNA synthetase